MHIRHERPADVAAVRALNQAAFARDAEADLVDTLRHLSKPNVSLVAEDAGAPGMIAGHILFTPVTLPSAPDLRIAGLAPMAVTPARQRQGIGSALVRRGLDDCRTLGCVAVVVLGYPRFYSRFGFVPASRFGLHSTYAVPDDVFMALELSDGALSTRSGVIHYHPAFSAVE